MVKEAFEDVLHALLFHEDKAVSKKASVALISFQKGEKSTLKRRALCDLASALSAYANQKVVYGKK